MKLADLEMKIMNLQLPSDLDMSPERWWAYKRGFRDARHAAVEALLEWAARSKCIDCGASVDDGDYQLCPKCEHEFHVREELTEEEWERRQSMHPDAQRACGYWLDLGDPCNVCDRCIKEIRHAE